jgi:2-iminobutanoate/2-iminopropanoate deaminase
MLERWNPGGICPPPANYSHATVVPAGARWLFASGQLGVRPDGTVPEGVSEQAEEAFANVLAILVEGGMDAGDIIRISAFLTDPADRAAYMAVRDRHVGSPPPSSTLVVVQALAQPAFKIEIEVVAARSDTT